MNWIRLATIGMVDSWDCHQGGSVGGDFSEIEATIRRKEKRLPEARRRARCVWLLIVAPGELIAEGRPDIAFSSMLPLLPEFERRRWTYAFDRVYLGEYVRRMIVRLERA